jgi:hypothetical protein
MKCTVDFDVVWHATKGGLSGAAQKLLFNEDFFRWKNPR